MEEGIGGKGRTDVPGPERQVSRYSALPQPGVPSGQMLRQEPVKGGSHETVPQPVGKLTHPDPPQSGEL